MVFVLLDSRGKLVFFFGRLVVINLFCCCIFEKFWLYIGIFVLFGGVCNGDENFVLFGLVFFWVELLLIDNKWLDELVKLLCDGSKFIEGIVIVLWSVLWFFDKGVFFSFMFLVINGWRVKFFFELDVRMFLLSGVWLE